MNSLLSLRNVRAGYGRAVVLPDISLDLNEGEALAVLGRNGAGKTTLIDTIVGVTSRLGGTIGLGGRRLTDLCPEQRARAGLGWVPQERNIFRSLTVEENLTAIARPGAWTLKRAYELFPRLRERRLNLGHQLSGGEQQMLAIARALMLNPRILLLDEPTEGLAPIVVDEILKILLKIFKSDGMAAIIVEQHPRRILRLTDRAIILDRGSIVHAATAKDLLEDGSILEDHLTVRKKVQAPNQLTARAEGGNSAR
ncbi:ABC transporter ATP-binding protein [Bradyrhizobium sp. CB2312]|uniref:ABC transporter ATP-binding protein n=1 Tax=Bradyrhizobium sp. CB2312 TaxID=3039155 RepID=UPI0024B12450|nr:ABC transporter ATP-binding protein [Bradyrhizobium sp. CB2312]WFU75448.1 ABC transporter ATP-binding protein [Bradyrhizobium sp. CB2312]